MLIIFLPFWRYISTQECKLAGWRGGRGVNSQSWAHRSYKLSERSKAMSDLWFSEWKKMSVERWANCQKKEFAHRSKRSLNLKERAFWAVRSLSDVTVLSFWGAVYSKNTVLLHNGGSCNACTLKRCITFRCITKQTMLLNVAIT